MQGQRGIILIGIILLIGLFAAQIQAEPTVKLHGFTQATVIKTQDNKGFVFDFDRVRLIAKGKLNDLAEYKLQVDFMKTDTDVDKDGETPAIIKDAEIKIKVYENIKVSVGKFKTPIGMEFCASGAKLDLVKRGLGQALVFERNVGAMVHASKLGQIGFGFAAGAFNSGPNQANTVGDPAKGNDYTVAGRLSINPQKVVYVQTYFGSALTSVDQQESVSIFGVGTHVKLMKELSIKGEFMSRTDAQNNDADGTDFYAQAGYLLHPGIEPVVKYEQLDVTNDAMDQANITVGFNYYLNPDNIHQTKIMINYVESDLDGQDAIQLMVQAVF
ncbi:hypothetical protein CEE37_00010 [candidate division LCP-89 bacterium B3_LCP]|uniref:Porin domain-containing protein n=1 Tax=candidate division LCP-89 bacterium B3_LCP TaxID=2012998 RepID=A0A532V537_UNCL8|nr:MAG: hypothetical protein CEE37_00010 [candidate division LCP-89 bacterium B3_LCP]